MFRLIGHYELHREGDLIVIRSEPEFNVEAARQYAHDMTLLIAEMPPIFGSLICFESPPIVGPEVEEAMYRFARHPSTQGLVAAAFVIASEDALTIARGQWHRVYDGSGIVLRFFSEETSAREWLAEVIERARVGRKGDVEKIRPE
jgi:hypothetical protein